ncbi:hypothetical protein TWF281_007947 [Arthrobotrys megalospora]
MDFLNKSPATPRSRTLSFSKLRRIPSFKKPKSRREEPNKKPDSPPRRPEDETRKASKLSQLKSRLSNLYSKSTPSSPRSSTETPVPKIPEGLLSTPASDSRPTEVPPHPITSTPSSRRVTFSDAAPVEDLGHYGTRKHTPQLTTSDWPLSAQNVPSTKPQVNSTASLPVANPQIAPLQAIGGVSPISQFSLNTDTPSPFSSGTSSPAQSFHTARGNFSPIGTPFIPSDASITSSDAVYRYSNPAKFWDKVHRRNERERLRQERVKEEQRELSLCERIRMERFRKRGESSSGSSTGERETREEQQQFIFPETANYDSDDSDDSEDEDSGYIGFDWMKKLEERYYGVDGDGENDKVDEREELGDDETSKGDDDENDKSEMTYWERIEELRRAVGNAVADVALRPSDWRKMID